MKIVNMIKMVNAGCIILRPMFDARIEKYKIVKLTNNGGWARFDENFYNAKEDCETTIDTLCSIKVLRAHAEKDLI